MHTEECSSSKRPGSTSAHHTHVFFSLAVATATAAAGLGGNGASQHYTRRRHDTIYSRVRCGVLLYPTLVTTQTPTLHHIYLSIFTAAQMAGSRPIFLTLTN